MEACELGRFPVLSPIISTCCIPGEAQHTALHASLPHYRGGDRDRDEGLRMYMWVCVTNSLHTNRSRNSSRYGNEMFEVPLSSLNHRTIFNDVI